MNRKIIFIVWIFSLAATIAAVSSCKKEKDDNVLTGETNIPLTQKDSTTSLYFNYNGQNAPGTEIQVVENKNGLVTYAASFDLQAIPDSLKNLLLTILPQLIDYYNPKDVSWNLEANGTINVQFKLKITSEGIQSYFVDGKPWTIRYDDPQGSSRSITRDNGDVMTATVTEKTGQDDWPFGFMYIKTSKVEINAPASDPVMQKVIYRINHKFGVVYLKAEGKDGRVLEIDLIPWFLI